jgi:outer membrane receptor protein involved in Fe transport
MQTSVTRFVLRAAAVVAALPPVLSGQQAPAAAPTGSAPARPIPVEEVVQLSPFQVAAETDRGYQALNTLSGTRLNSKLEDLGASITVITKQQLLDTAAVDLNDIFMYEANTEGTHNYTQFTPNRNGGIIDGVANDPATANRIRGVGSPISGSGVNIAVGNFSSNARIPVDPYNIDAVEISRGPNSNLFGLGAAAGTVNLVPSKANLRRAATSTSIRVDDEGSHRVTLDVGRPIIDDKLALRFSAVSEEKAFTRKPSGEEITRYFGAVQARPFRHTTLNASFERYENEYRRPNSLMPRDGITEWRLSGSPTFDPVTQRVTFANGTTSGPYPVTNENNLLPPGLMAGGTYGRTVAYLDPSGVQFFTQGRIANPVTSGTPSPFTNNSNVRYIQSGTDIMRRKANPYPLFFAPSIKDASLYDYENINAIAANSGADKAQTLRMEAEQVIFNNSTHLVAARAGYFRQEFQRQSYGTIENTDTVVYIDVNSRLLDGRPNPNLGRPFIQAPAPFVNRQIQIGDTANADLAYQFTPRDFPRWLNWIGTQRLAAHLERNINDSRTYTYGQWISSDHPWVNRANRVGGTQLAQRFYVGDANGSNVDYAPAALGDISGNYNLNWFNNLTGQWVNEPTTVGLLSRPSTTKNRNELRTISLVTQNYFFRDRLITTVGWRRDRRRERTSAQAAVDPATGLVNYNAWNTWGVWTDDVTGPLGPATREAQRGDTKTYGAVLRPLSWLNFYYNRSDSFFPQVVRYAMDLNGVLPNAKGEGEDYGLSFTALKGKLNIKLNRYKTVEEGSRAGEIGTLGNRTFRLEGRPENNGVRDANGFYPWALALANRRFAAQGVTPSAAQSNAAAARIMGVTDDWMAIFLSAGNGQPQTNGLSDVVSRGYEVEVTYNPTNNWRIKFTGAQQEAIDAKVGREMNDYWNSRLPTWTTARDDEGRLWWNTIPQLGGATPEEAYYNSLLSPYLFGVANEGKPRTQVRKYRWNAVTNYSFTEGRLKNFHVGGGVRWEDKASIGFYGKAPSTLPGSFNGVILELDPARPIWDKARYYFDATVGYRMRFGDKIRANLQLNVRNLFEDGRLQAVGANPDGSIYAYRIIDPRRFIFSASFDL